MSREKVSIISAITIFSIVIGMLFLCFSVYIQSSMQHMDIDAYMEEMHMDYDVLPEDVHVQTPPAHEQVYRIIDAQNFKNYTSKQLYRLILPLTIAFCIFIAFAATLLWKYLKRIKEKENMRIVEDIRSIQWNQSLPLGSMELVQAYAHIRSEYEQHMQDFRRLNSYLSHDQRNTLMLLRSNVEHGRKEAALHNIQQLTESINDILTLSDHQEQNETLLPVDVILICADVCDTYQKVYDKISFVFPEHEELYILAKPRWIQQAVGNLLDNAVKYGLHKPIEVRVQKIKNSIQIIVADHGIGMPLDKQEQIFQHHYRIDELKKDGYGIGLSLVAHVCDLCGGFIYCDSKEHVGTTFYMSFQAIENQI